MLSVRAHCDCSTPTYYWLVTGRYLADDMQFFILGLILLKINLKSVRVGVALCVLVSIGGVVAGWVLLIQHRNKTLDDYFDKPCV